ncbi:acyltransferase family protein [Ferruginibacter sp. SUN002]|uniref:acyltransferase family protein n=1 Tax=Ferruginibacter sp. SUN002 TaxID=2937789 RepID=UPI003D362F3E
MTFSTQPQTAAAPSRFDALTGFRCLAACMVFVYHNRKYWRAELNGEVLRLFNEFHAGVALFFVLSGFLIAYTYSEKPLASGKAYAGYILLRSARILPLYWLILTCYYLDPAYGKGGYSVLTYTLAHGFSDQHNLDGISQAWSLNVEMMFYIVAPVLCYLQRRHVILAIGFLVLLFLFSWGVGACWHHLNGNKDRFFYPVEFIFSSTFPGRSSEFLAGVLMAAAIKNENNFLKNFPHKTWIGFVGTFATCYAIGFFQPDIYHHGTDTVSGLLIRIFILPLFVVIALSGLIMERTWTQRFFSTKLLVLLGNASFAFYLVHISYVNLKLQTYFLLPDRNFLVLWGISILLYLLYEKNIYNLFRRWLKPITKR